MKKKQRKFRRPFLLCCRLFMTLAAALIISSCALDSNWNNPYPAKHSGRNIYYSSFSERPKHLDPARSYSSNEITFTGQIYEPPLQYHYLKRPYQLIPLAATEIPRPQYFDKNDAPLPADAGVDRIEYTLYEIRIKKGVQYQPHPAFARDDSGALRYQNISEEALSGIYELADFKHTAARELVANDYVYQIKRLAHPRLHSPIYGMMAEYIIGLRELAKQLRSKSDKSYIDLDAFDLSGVHVVDSHTYTVRIKGKYPQFLYWLAMPFFAPVPPEADAFYSQKGLIERNITLDWYPVGTGPYMLSVNNPNRQMILEKNPNYHGENYPLDGDPDDSKDGLLNDAGKPLPFIDKAIYSLEKETIPYWNKFLQGYYDSSGISSDNFDQAVSMSAEGATNLTDQMRDKGIRLMTSVSSSIFYTGFNMLDPVLGGAGDSARKLRQAISIAMDFEEYISIFANGRGIPAQGPLPVGIFGYKENRPGMNPYVYEWSGAAAKRHPIEYARQLVADAGYPDGRDKNTGEPLILYMDIIGGGADDKSRLDWIRKQFNKLNIQLIFRATDYNRFQDKMRNGSAQIFQWGWNADYPDPENFFFLLYGPNGKTKHGGENAANFENKRFDKLFEEMKNMNNGPKRQEIIDKMVEIARYESPWIWGFHPKNFGLFHKWIFNAKPNLMANNTLKYRRIDPAIRDMYRSGENRPVIWPIFFALFIIIVIIAPAVLSFKRRERRKQEVAI